MKPRIIGHRGAAGTHPENTQVSIMAALELGVKWVEVDVQPTKDHVLVVCHDHTIDRCSNGHGRVDQFTYGELLQYDFGSWFDKRFANERIMTLKQLLALALKHDFFINIEVKVDEFHDLDAVVLQLKKLLDANPDIYQHILISSFDPTVNRLVALNIPNAKVGVITNNLSADDIELMDEIKAFSCHLDYHHLSESDFNTLRAIGVEIWCFTVNRPSVFNLVNQVDAIFTDFPSHFFLNQSLET
jgi:glycerophosphoryl diester phosphodiesterase